MLKYKFCSYSKNRRGEGWRAGKEGPNREIAWVGTPAEGKWQVERERTDLSQFQMNHKY